MNRAWTIAASALAAGMAFIDTTVLTVALPALRESLPADDSALLWIHNAYAVPLAALLLIGGSLGDRYGIRRTFLAGIVLFGLASVGCGFSPDAPSLISLRMLQGCGAALMIPGSLSLIARETPGGSLGKTVGLWSTFTVIATAIGPVLGGLLVQAGLWRWVFFINAPLALVAIAITLSRVPPDPPAEDRAPPLDWTGAALLALALGLLSYALIDRPPIGAAALVAFGLFLWRQQRAQHPLVPASTFRSRPLVSCIVISLLIYGAWGGFTYLLPSYLIESLGLRPAKAGLFQLPSIVLLAGLSPLAGKLLDRHGPRLPLSIGATLSTAGFAALLWPGFSESAPALILLPLLLLGAGLGFCAAPLSATIMGNIRADHRGLAAGINSTTARIAGAIGVALLGTVAFRGGTPDLHKLSIAAAILCVLCLPAAVVSGGKSDQSGE